MAILVAKEEELRKYTSQLNDGPKQVALLNPSQDEVCVAASKDVKYPHSRYRCDYRLKNLLLESCAYVWS